MQGISQVFVLVVFVLANSIVLNSPRRGFACADLNQAEMDKLSAEVAQQRPLWEQSKQMEELHHAEIAEVNQQRKQTVLRRIR